MIRLNVVAEGQTEETFVNDVLAPHLARFDVITSVHCVTTRKHAHKIHRGGCVAYSHLKKDITIWTRQDRDRNCRFTTMIDLYRLPKDFPEFAAANRLRPFVRRVEALENAFATDIEDHRFIPYIQLHEFETMLFADLDKLKEQFPGASTQIDTLNASVVDVPPEDVNDGASTAPSRRLTQAIPSYAGLKSSAGPLVAAAIGIEKIASLCPHFARWLKMLEGCGK
jgi:hypothetical protein